MIYSITEDKFPNEDQYIECHSYQDENNFEWRIARIKNGFMIGYFGDQYFKDKHFPIETPDNRFLILNTGFFFVSNTEFETFYQFREILKTGYTDDIWESITDFLTERLTHDPGLMECEINVFK